MAIQSCGQCGAPALEGAALCRHCHTPFATTTEEDDAALRRFVGARYPYYQRKWTIASERQTNWSWNWAAFFLGFFWLAYRKMYRLVAVLAVIGVAIGLLEALLRLPNLASLAINQGFAFVIGARANHWYHAFATRRIEALRLATAPDQYQARLTWAGGTSPIAPLLLLLALIFLIELTILLMDWYDPVSVYGVTT